MSQVIVVRPGTHVWAELQAMRTGLPGWAAFTAPDAVARELGLATGTVCVGQVFSRYIGETEKNLAKVFAAAEERQAVVLLFDEADALFGKRTGVRDADDRFADADVWFPLRRLALAQSVPLAVRRNRQRLRTQGDPDHG